MGKVVIVPRLFMLHEMLIYLLFYLDMLNYH
jgi:hypothetical protein